MKTPPPPPRVASGFDQTIGRLSLIALSLAVFLLFRPYQGIMHDARLYVGYAMAALDPDGIGREIVFVNDGQSKFSVYPILMRELARSIGPSYAAIVLTYSGLLLWFAAFVALVRGLLRDRMSEIQMTAVIVLAVSLPAFYGGQGVFRTAEFYATPRVFAEACVLAAFAGLLAQRTMIVVAALVVGLAFHPLMTAPAIGGVLWYHAQSPAARRRLVGAALFGTAALMAGTLMLGHVGKPFARFDAEWMKALQAKHALVFIHNWRVGDAIRIVVHLTTVTMATLLLGAKAQRLVWSALVAVGAGAAVSEVGADLLSNVLITQVQGWRGLWMLATLATVMLGVLLWSAWMPLVGAQARTSANGMRKASSVFLLIAWSMVEINSSAMLFALLAIAFWTLPSWKPDLALPPRGLQLIVAMGLLIAMLNVGAQSWITMTTAWSSPDVTMRRSGFTMVSTGVPGLLTVLFVAAVLSGRLQGADERSRRLFSWTACALFVVTMAQLDSRTRYQRYIERELDARADGVPPAAVFTPGRSILWPYADLEPWALAGSSGWGTIVQGMPSVFSRELAIRWAKRNEALSAAGLLPVAQTGAETMAVVKSSLESQEADRLCASPDAPGTLAIPTDDSVRAGSASRFHAGAPRILHPLAIGQPWRRIDQYSLVRCGE